MTSKPEKYWVTRNAIVDAVRVVRPSSFIPAERVYVATTERSEYEARVWAIYGAALALLNAFDEAHGGEPIL